jgi:CO/xanthine dehydrogenase FAD-binding subunit
LDLNTVTEVVRRPSARPGADWRPDDAYLAGGTWLFAEPQTHLRRLVDLTTLGWTPLRADESGLEIGATCTISDLYAHPLPPDWPAAELVWTSCEAFLASFKIWNAATVGGNICMALPAGPMITLTVALEATYRLWAADGSERTLAAADFVVGNNQNVLRPGELLRSVHIPAVALRKQHAHRRFCLTKLGRSTIFMVGTRDRGSGDVLLTITAGTTHPVCLSFGALPQSDELAERIDAIADTVWFDDPNGSPAHRRHLARHFAEEIRVELGDGTRL